MTLERLPDWSASQEAGPVPDFTETARLAAAVAALEQPERRAEIAAFSHAHCLPNFELDQASGLYLLLRLLFDLPSAHPLEDTLVFGGWIHPSIARDPFDLSWPARVDLAARTFVVERFRGYRGKGYDGIGEYDWFAELFELRRSDDLGRLEQRQE